MSYVYQKDSRKGVKSISMDLVTSSDSFENINFQERCRKNYTNSYKMYKKFFLDCVDEIESLQPSGYACIQASRYFTVGVLPKYCTIPDPLTPKQRERVERLLAD